MKIVEGMTKKQALTIISLLRSDEEKEWEKMDKDDMYDSKYKNKQGESFRARITAFDLAEKCIEESMKNDRS